MDSEAQAQQARGDGKQPAGNRRWFATFSLLDLSGSISSSQMTRFLALLSRLWRRTLGKLAVV